MIYSLALFKVIKFYLGSWQELFLQNSEENIVVLEYYIFSRKRETKDSDVHLGIALIAYS